MLKLSLLKLVYVAIVSALLFILAPFIAAAADQGYVPVKPGDMLYSYYKNQYGNYYDAKTYAKNTAVKNANNESTATYKPTIAGDMLYSYNNNQYGTAYNPDTYQFNAKNANNEKPETVYKPEDPGNMLYSYNNKNYGEYYNATTYKAPTLTINNNTNNVAPAKIAMPEVPSGSYEHYQSPYVYDDYYYYDYSDYDYGYDYGYYYDNTADYVMGWVDYGLSFVGLGW